jgi:subtilisin family serine protease
MHEPRVLIARFTPSAARNAANALERERAYLTALFPELDATYFNVSSQDDRPHELAKICRSIHGCLGAYVRSAPRPASMPMHHRDAQRHLDAAPGLGVSSLWKAPGGNGQGVRVLIYDYAIDEDHVCFQHGLTSIDSVKRSDPKLRDHGTAVAGVVGARQVPNGSLPRGVSGCAPGASMIFFAVSRGRMQCSDLWKAHDQLEEGDILLLPQTARLDTNVAGAPTFPWVPLEWFPDMQIPIEAMTKKGIIVVQAAGNDDANLDDPLFDAPPKPGHFPSWRNPFSVARGSGPSSIIVGASHVDIQQGRMPYSNFGRCVDVQGWGENVVTCGYGDLEDPGDPHCRFTAAFSGTSAAAAMIAGTLACLQGVRKVDPSKGYITPANARAVLLTHATKAPASYEPIGDRPDWG